MHNRAWSIKQQIKYSKEAEYANIKTDIFSVDLTRS